MNSNTKLTLEALIAKKEQRKAERYEIHKVEVPSLGGYLQLEKIPLARVAGMMDDVGGQSVVDNLNFEIDLVYACCPMLRNKELQAAYEVEAPTDIVCAVLGDNMGDLNLIAATILDMYGLADVDLKTAVKN